ncbi:MAG: TcpE family conjugal transfer membrane protein [Solirubrobacterales bacterium]
MSEPETIRLRGFRRVFNFERRLFQIHDWRIPYPHGIPLRGIGYFVAAEFCVLCLSKVPPVSLLCSLIGAPVTYGGVPILLAVLLTQVRIDGRPPHHVLCSLAKYQLQAKCLAGLAPAPDCGSLVAPLDDLTIAHDARESFTVKGRIKGPARVTFRYPSEGKAEKAPWWVLSRDRRIARARRYRIRRRPNGRPMLRGKVISVPEGGEVLIE